MMMASGYTLDAKQYPGMFITKRDPDHRNEEMYQVDTGITKSEFRYKMNNNRRTALIINNEKFKNKRLPRRKGSPEDVECMKEALRKLKFKVIVHTNQSVKQMKELFEDIQKTEPSVNDCLVVVIMSHGADNGVIYGYDVKKVTVTDLITYLIAQNCPSLIGKPKLFFVQACRGSKFDSGKEVYEGDAEGTKPDSGEEVLHDEGDAERTKPDSGKEVHGVDAEGTKPGPGKKVLHGGNAKGSIPEKDKIEIPSWPDVLIHYSIIPGHYSWRNKASGSWFIQSLGDVLKEYGENKELIQLLTMVNCKVAKCESRTKPKETDRMKAMPIFSSTLTRKLYFS